MANNGNRIHKKVSELNVKIGSARAILTQISRGGKPYLDLGVEEDRFIAEYLTSMSEEGFLTENAEKYYSTIEHQAVGLTRDHPITNNLTDIRRSIDTRLREVSVENVRILGTKVKDRNDSRKQKLIKTAEAFVMPNKGDIFSALEFLDIIEARAKAIEFNEPESLEASKPIILEDYTDFHVPFISKFLGMDQEMRDYLGITKTKDIEATLDQLLPLAELQASRKQEKMITNPKHSFVIKPGSTIANATTNDKKLFESQHALMEKDINVINIMELMGVFPDALEHHLTYAGNAVGSLNPNENSGKMYKVLNAFDKFINKLAEKEFDKFLEDNNIKQSDLGVTYSEEAIAAQSKLKAFNKIKEKAGIEGDLVIMTEDRGLNGDPVVMKYFDYSNTGAIKQPKHAPKPGVEMTHWISSKGGTENFVDEYMKAVKRAINAGEKVDYLLDEAGNLVSSPMTDVSVIAISVYQPNTKMEDREIETFAGLGSVRYTSSPKPEVGKLVEPENFQIPNIEGEFRTMAQMPIEESIRYSAVGKALTSMSYHTGLSEKTKPKDNIKVTPATVGFSNFSASNVESFQEKELKNALDKAGIKYIGNSEKSEIKNDLTDIETQMMSKSNSWTFIDSADESIIDKGYKFFSAIVAKQLDPRDINKPIIVYKPSEDMKKLISIYEDLYSLGLIKEYPKRMFQIAETPEEYVELVKKGEKDYKETNITYPEEKTPEFFDNGKPSVFVCCSASSETEEDLKNAKKIGYSLASQGFNVAYGSGDKKMMGAVREGVLEWNEKQIDDTKKVNLIGSSTPHIMGRETLKGTFPSGLDNKYPAVRIEGRMAYLIGSSQTFKKGMESIEVSLISSSMVVDAGGAGTVQELFAGLKLKQDNHPSVAGGFPQVVHNKSVKSKKGERKLYDAVKDVLGEDLLRKYDVHFEDTLDKTINKSIELTKSVHKKQIQEIKNLNTTIEGEDNLKSSIMK